MRYIHVSTNSKSKLLFGALPYRKNEIMCSCADLHPLLALGWKPCVEVKDGVLNLIKSIKKHDKEGD